MDGQVMDAADQVDGDAKEPTMRRRLGRGLHALLSGANAEDAPAVQRAGGGEPDASEVSIELIQRNPFQPRKNFDDESMSELVESIKQHGVLQAVLVRPFGGEYQLIAGERRLVAAKRAGLETIPCRVLEFEDQQVYQVALVENLQRQDLTVLEKAQAFQDYLDRYGSTLDQLARQLGLSRSAVSNFIRMLELAEPVRKALAADKISHGHARALVTLDQELQLDFCRRIQREALSVRQTELAVRALKNADDGPDTIPFEQHEPPAESPAAQPTSHVLSLQDQLRDQLGAKVEIKLKSQDAGRIVIHFDSNDQFEGILRQLRRAA
ncbi:MAG: ParB/RepB/Spo0J family partition protein [Planctomycetaceae bacterium]